MIKKSLSALLLAALVIVPSVFSGCGKSPAPSSGDGASPLPASAPGEQKTLNILMETVPDTTCVMNNIDKFTEQTGIKVNIESINYSSMHEKLLTQMLSKTNSYDVIVVDCYWTGEFTTAGWLENLDPYIARDSYDTSPYIGSMMDMVGKVDGVTYMLPFYNYMLSLVYRTDVFEDKELAEAYKTKFGEEFAIPDNMADYVELCKFITATKGESMSGAVMQGLRPDPIAMEWMNYLFSCGGDFYDAEGNISINSPEAVKALDLYMDNIANAAPKGAAGFGFDEAFNVFAQGNAATYVTYNWMVQKLDNQDESTVAGKVDIRPMPGGISLNAGWGWGIPHNAPDKDASWEFIKWVESFEIAKARTLAGGSPTRRDVMEDADVLKVYPHLKTVQAIMENSKMIPVIADAPQLVEVLGRELSEAVAGSKTSKQALDTVAEEMKKMK